MTDYLTNLWHIIKSHCPPSSDYLCPINISYFKGAGEDPVLKMIHADEPNW